MLYLGIFGLESEKAIVIFEIKRPQICLTAKFGAKKNFLNMGPKMLNLRILGLEFEQNCCHI